MGSQHFFSRGKLLLTGEYLIMDGAEGLALPLKVGQSMTVRESPAAGKLEWIAEHPTGSWFSCEFQLPEIELIATSDVHLAEKLTETLRQIRKIKPEFLTGSGYAVKTHLDFDPGAGLGSSSTLIINLARWAKVDPYRLQRVVFKGSGYDIAAGMSGKPILYSLKNRKPTVEPVNFNPPFKQQLFFVYLGAKQRSLREIERFRSKAEYSENEIEEISKITRFLLETDDVDCFEELINTHEKFMSKVLNKPSIKTTLFKSYPFAVKSLGAWGGDFALVVSKKGRDFVENEIRKMGLNTFFSYDELVVSEY